MNEIAITSISDASFSRALLLLCPTSAQPTKMGSNNGFSMNSLAPGQIAATNISNHPEYIGRVIHVFSSSRTDYPRLAEHAYHPTDNGYIVEIELGGINLISIAGVYSQTDIRPLSIIDNEQHEPLQFEVDTKVITVYVKSFGVYTDHLSRSCIHQLNELSAEGVLPLASSSEQDRRFKALEIPSAVETVLQSVSSSDQGRDCRLLGIPSTVETAHYDCEIYNLLFEYEVDAEQIKSDEDIERKRISKEMLFAKKILLKELEDLAVGVIDNLREASSLKSSYKSSSYLLISFIRGLSAGKVKVWQREINEINKPKKFQFFSISLFCTPSRSSKIHDSQHLAFLGNLDKFLQKLSEIYCFVNKKQQSQKLLENLHVLVNSRTSVMLDLDKLFNSPELQRHLSKVVMPALPDPLRMGLV